MVHGHEECLRDGGSRGGERGGGGRVNGYVAAKPHEAVGGDGRVGCVGGECLHVGG
jgi:hypothetical protein